MSLYYSGPGSYWDVTTTTAEGRPPTPHEKAPGFTLSDLETLLREHYAKGYADGQRSTQAAATKRIASERHQAAREAEADLLQWMWPNVLGRVQTCAEIMARTIDGPKSTIAKDRERMADVLDRLKQTLHYFHQKKPRDAS